jgi:MerR family redox-sensitive transcriptional activator SoxR
MEMTIGEVAARVGLRPSALRYYERVGLLPRARRVNGRRRYGPEVFEWIAGIRLSQQAGFTVAEIRRLFFGFPRSVRPSERWGALATEKLAELDEMIHRARVMRRLLEEGIRCGCASFEECTLLPDPGEPTV